MKIKALYLTALAVTLVTSTLQAQHEKEAPRPYCASEQMHHALLQRDPYYAKLHNSIEESILNISKHHRSGAMELESATAMSTYTLPVVIHLIVPPGTPVGQGNNLTDEAVEAGLALLNQSFANQGAFQTPNGVDVGIQFCMARRDPQGQPTNGITRHESTLVAETTPCSPFGTNAANDAALKQLVNWDCSQYINIWLVTDLFNANFGCGLAGYAYFPGAPCNIDGIVQESRYWTTASGTQITAHEMGHYLNLFHTFQGGCPNGDCLVDGDRVCDTPPDGSPSFAPCNTNSCNTDSPDLPDDNTNYMDYTSCLPLHFTEGQRLRMVAGLETGRASLLTSSACQPVALWDVAISIQNDPTCPTKLCPLVRLKNNGLNTINTLQVHWKINNGPDQLYNWAGTLTPDAAVQVALPCQTVAPGQYALSATADAPNGNPDQFPANNTNTLSGITIASLSATFEVMTGTNGFTKIFVNNSTGASTYLWDFGDGTTSTQANPTHTYATV
ncbi:MAG TPA: M43 family zinc metalloprotease, partial [Saprospiraceae bacterium]|nr:M43 family zinc metalloprotease [Saprospiraceae bacterium]